MNKLLLLMALLSCGCEPLWSMSSAPPTTQAEFQIMSDRIDVTQGVALAIACRDVWSGGPCENMTVTSDDPTIAGVSFVHLDKYRSAYGHVSDIQSQRSAFLVAGVTPGKTTIRIGGDDANEIIEVYVH
jgi:hypothetical protein